MSTIETEDGTHLYYKDWGSGQPIVFSHGWPLSADAWDAQMLFLANNGYRVVAHDRRSHGRSEQTWNNNTMDQYADDLADIFNALDLHDIVMIGHSTGGGEVARYIERHGTSRVVKAVLIGSVTPILLNTAENPKGLPLAVFDAMRKQVFDNRAQYFKDFTLPFYGYNRPGAKISEGVRDSFWRQGMMAGIAGVYECIKQFSETNFTEDLKKMTLPTLVVHGDDDQIVPIEFTALRTVDIAPQATLKVYPRAPHGLPTICQDQLNADLLAFVKS